MFGGESEGTYMTQVLSEEGELIEDLSSDPLIPGYKCQSSYLIREGKIYTGGWKELYWS